jgi:hypothetical protein
MSTTTVSAAKVQANRRNAQESTGPRTPGGKARSSAAADNALKHCLLARQIVLECPLRRWQRTPARFRRPADRAKGRAPRDHAGAKQSQTWAISASWENIPPHNFRPTVQPLIFSTTPAPTLGPESGKGRRRGPAAPATDPCFSTARSSGGAPHAGDRVLTIRAVRRFVAPRLKAVGQPWIRGGGPLARRLVLVIMDGRRR